MPPSLPSWLSNRHAAYWRMLRIHTPHWMSTRASLSWTDSASTLLGLFSWLEISKSTFGNGQSPASSKGRNLTEQWVGNRTLLVWVTPSLIYTKYIQLGTKLHQQTRIAMQRCTPALMAAIQNFIKYCNSLVTPSDPTANILLPQHLNTDPTFLQDDLYLMEDVWVHLGTNTAPPWLTDSKVRKGIHVMLKVDHCTEEFCHLSIEANVIPRNCFLSMDRIFHTIYLN